MAVEQLVFDQRAAALARRVANARRTRLRTLSGRHALFFTSDAMARLAALEREEPVELTYTLAALSVALGISTAAVRASVKRGKFPRPDRTVAGEPRWRADTVEPILARLGRPTVAERLKGDVRQKMREAGSTNWRGRGTQRAAGNG